MPSTASSTLLGDQATLNANRYGQLAPWQRQHLKPPALIGSLILVGLAGAFVAPLCLFFLVQFLRGIFNHEYSEQSVSLIFLGFFALALLALLPMLLVPLGSLRGKLRLRRDLMDGYIAQEDGQVIFKTSVGYVARTAGQALRSLEGDQVVDLPPGNYHFYYLPHTRRILSAERQMLFEPGGPQAGLLLALSQAHGFSLEELEQNRQGLVSGGQRGRLRGRLALLCVLTAGLVVGAVWQRALLVESTPWGYIILGLVLLGLIAMMVNRWRDLQDGRVLMLEGYVRGEEHSSDDSSTYYYVLDNEKFTVSGAAYRALVSGQRYRLYYLGHSKKLVSIEPLP